MSASPEFTSGCKPSAKLGRRGKVPKDGLYQHRPGRGWSHGASRPDLTALNSLGALLPVFPFKNKSVGQIISLVFLIPVFQDLVTVSIQFPSVMWKQCIGSLWVWESHHMKRNPGQGDVIYWAAEVGQELYVGRGHKVSSFSSSI